MTTACRAVVVGLNHFTILAGDGINIENLLIILKLTLRQGFQSLNNYIKTRAARQWRNSYRSASAGR